MTVKLKTSKTCRCESARIVLHCETNTRTTAATYRHVYNSATHAQFITSIIINNTHRPSQSRLASHHSPSPRHAAVTLSKLHFIVCFTRTRARERTNRRGDVSQASRLTDDIARAVHDQSLDARVHERERCVAAATRHTRIDAHPGGWKVDIDAPRRVTRAYASCTTVCDRACGVDVERRRERR